MTKDLEALYQEAKTALAAKEFDRAADLLRQILLEDHEYKDVSRLLAQTIKLKRRRWYNDPRVWGAAGVLAVAALLVWLVPRLPASESPPAEQPTAIPTLSPEPTGTQAPMAAQASTATVMPSPTPMPLVWKRISTGQEFSRDTITTIVVDPKDRDIIYVGMENAGIYKSIDGGSSWSPVQQGLTNAQIRSMVIDPQDPQILLAGTLGGVYKTWDGGASWEMVSSETGTFLLMDSEDSAHIYFSDGWNIFASSNQGITWTLEYFPGSECHQRFEDIKIDPQNGDHLISAKKGGAWPCVGGVFDSVDGGQNWDRVGLGDADAVAIAKEENAKDMHFACGDTLDPNPDFPGEGFHFTNNAGKNWNYKQIECGLLITNPDNLSRVYIGGNQGGLAISNLTGGIVNLALTGEMITAIHVDEVNGQERIIVGVERNGLFISEDGGVNWTLQLGGIGAAYIGLKTNAELGERIFANIQYNNTSCTLYRSDDGARNWETLLDIETNYDPRRESFCNPAFDAENTLYTIQNLALAQSKNGGESWNFLSLPPIPDQINVSRWVSANPYLPDLIYLFAWAEPYIHYSEDFGKSWQDGSSAETQRYYEGNNGLFFADQGQIIYTEGMKSLDAGASWYQCGWSFSRNQKSDTFIAIDPQDSGHLIAATSGKGIMQSSDGCHFWSSSNDGIPGLYINSVAVDHENPWYFYAGSDSGAYVSVDRGVTWQEINDGLLGATVVYSIVVDDTGTVFAATPYGIFKLASK